MSGIKLPKGDSDTLRFTIDYAVDQENAARADGPFDVTIGDIEFVWSTVDVNAS